MLKKYNKNGNLWIAGAFLIMFVLFVSSSQTYQEQSQVSSLQHYLGAKPLFKELSTISFYYAGKTISIEKLGYFPFVEFLLRKFAHFSTYFLLGFCWFMGLCKKMRKEQFIIGFVSVMSSAGYAAMDEFHQSFTGGRSPLFQDVVLDTIGAMTCVVLLLLFEWLKKRR